MAIISDQWSHTVLGWIPFAGLKTLKPQEAIVLTLFGKYTRNPQGEDFLCQIILHRLTLLRIQDLVSQETSKGAAVLEASTAIRFQAENFPQNHDVK